MLRQLEDKLVGEVTDSERVTLRHAALWFFLVLCGYYTLRPIREQIGTEYGIKNLAWLFKATFLTMLVAIPLYAALVSKFHRKKLVPVIYAFFCVWLIGFWAAMTFVGDSVLLRDLSFVRWLATTFSIPPRFTGGEVTAQEWTARILFIWISVYGLFIVSFFWSVVGDMFSPSQGRRLFGAIAGGGTAGGMTASLFATFMVKHIGQANLLWLPAIMLLCGLAVYGSLERHHERSGAVAEVKRSSGKATGGNPFSGFAAVFASKYLFAICLYGLLLATCGTTIYFQQSEIVDAVFDNREDKTQFFATINFFVQVVTLVLQTAVVGKLMNKFGLGLTLAVLPVAYIFGVTSLALAPSLAILAVITVTGRSAEYAIANPAREVLFTAVKREDRYKAKSFIDTIVRRGGDTIIGSIYRSLRETWGFAMTTLSWCIVPIAIGWVALGFFIGRENQRVVSRRVVNQKDTANDADDPSN